MNSISTVVQTISILEGHIGPLPPTCVNAESCEIPFRSVLFNIDSVSSGLFYALASVVFIFLVLSVLRIFRIWMVAKKPYTVKSLLKLFVSNFRYPIKDGFGQSRIYRRDLYAGIMHTFILYGMIAEFIATLIMTVHERHDMFFLKDGFLFGDVYIIYHGCL